MLDISLIVIIFYAFYRNRNDTIIKRAGCLMEMGKIQGLGDLVRTRFIRIDGSLIVKNRLAVKVTVITPSSGFL